MSTTLREGAGLEKSSLQLLTTNAPLGTTRLLTTTHATSAATAQAAALSASVMAQYPALWPETVRALIVHSAEWTPAMKARFPASRKKAPRIALHRRYGMGVPDLECRLIWSVLPRARSDAHSNLEWMFDSCKLAQVTPADSVSKRGFHPPGSRTGSRPLSSGKLVGHPTGILVTPVAARH